MKHEEILSYLLSKQDPCIIEQIYNKYAYKLIKLCDYLKKVNFSNLPLENYDFQIDVLNAIKRLKNVHPDSIKKYGFFNILKKVVVQNLICEYRKYNSNKQKILTNIINENCCDNYNLINYSNNDNYNLFQFKQMINDINEKIKNKNQKIVFQHLLNGYKPNEIANLTNLNIKTIYNSIMCLKKKYIYPYIKN